MGIEASFIDYIASWPAIAETTICFTAHRLPQRMHAMAMDIGQLVQ